MGTGPKMNKVKNFLSETKHIWKPALDKVVTYGAQKAKKKFGPRHHPLISKAKKLLNTRLLNRL